MIVGLVSIHYTVMGMRRRVRMTSLGLISYLIQLVYIGIEHLPLNVLGNEKLHSFAIWYQHMQEAEKLQMKLFKE
jgi:hypothetical protein